MSEREYKLHINGIYSFALFWFESLLVVFFTGLFCFEHLSFSTIFVNAEGELEKKTHTKRVTPNGNELFWIIITLLQLFDSQGNSKREEENQWIIHFSRQLSVVCSQSSIYYFILTLPIVFCVVWVCVCFVFLFAEIICHSWESIVLLHLKRAYIFLSTIFNSAYSNFYSFRFYDKRYFLFCRFPPEIRLNSIFHHLHLIASSIKSVRVYFFLEKSDFSGDCDARMNASVSNLRNQLSVVILCVCEGYFINKMMIQITQLWWILLTISLLYQKENKLQRMNYGQLSSEWN